MAGFVIHENGNASSAFHIGTPHQDIINTAQHRRVITLQLDGDELAAALWGLEHYVKH